MYRLHCQNSGEDNDETLYHEAWKGAEAYYFFKKWHTLSLEGKHYNAMCVAYRLQDYIQYLPQEAIYFAMAISASRCQHYGVCSQAFVKLQLMKHLNEDLQTDINSTAISIFSVFKTTNDNAKKRMCDNCKASVWDWLVTCSECDNKFLTCIVTGRIISSDGVWRCNVCKSFAQQNKMQSLRFCCLCKSPY